MARKKGSCTNKYAIYKGDEFVAVGTASEIAEQLGIKPDTVRWWSYPSAQKRNRGNARTAIKLCS